MLILLEKESWEDRLDHIDNISLGNPAQALEIVENVCNKLSFKSNPRSYLRALYLKGICLEYLGEFEKSIEVASVLLELSDKSRCELSAARAHNILGNAYYDLLNHAKALKHYRLGLKFSQKVNDTRIVGVLFNNIGEIYSILDLHNKAIYYYRKSMLAFLESGYIKGVSSTFINIGECYYKMDEFSYSKDYLEDAYVLCYLLSDERGISYFHNCYGSIYKKEGNIRKAIESFKLSLTKSKCTGNLVLIATNLTSIVDLLIELKDYSDAFNYATQLYDVTQNMQINRYISEASERLALVNEKIGSINEAYYLIKKSLKFNKLGEQENHEKVLRSASIEYEMIKKKKEKEVFQLKNVELREKNDELESLYRNIKTISKIGQDITSTLEFKDIAQRIYTNIVKIMDVDLFGIAIFKNKMIHCSYYTEDESPVYYKSIQLHNKNHLASWCIRNDKIIHINKFSDEYTEFIERLSDYQISSSIESIIYCPLRCANEVIGTITIQSEKVNAYTEFHVDTLLALGSYIAIALNNSQKTYMLEQNIVENRKVSEELELLNIQLEEMSYKDSLTGISNRRHSIEFLSYELEKAKRSKDLLTVMIVDVDFYKQYNDYYGHNEGDRCLINIAEILRNTLNRKVDFVARYGGDEFLIIMSGLSLEQSKKFGQLLCNNVRDARIKHKNSNYGVITVTIGGVCLLPNSELSIEEIIHLADVSLYEAKHEGRNRVVFNEVRKLAE